MSTERPSWAGIFLKRYHIRVTFGVLPDGRKPVAYVQVVTWCLREAEKKAILVARSLFRDDKMVLRANAKAEGYPMKELVHVRKVKR